MTASLPGIGALRHDDNWYSTEPLSAPLLGADAVFTVFDYEPDSAGDIASAITNFRALSPNALESATQAVYAYYRDVYQACVNDGDEEALEWLPIINEPAAVWDHVQLGDELAVKQGEDDEAWYVALDCECDWEEEQGLVLVFRDGTQITKVGPADGLMTWADDDRDASGDGLYRVPDFG